MNQEKEMTQISNSAGGYLAPKIEIVEIRVLRVMCQSGTFSNPQENDLG